MNWVHQPGARAKTNATRDGVGQSSLRRRHNSRRDTAFDPLSITVSCHFIAAVRGKSRHIAPYRAVFQPRDAARLCYIPPAGRRLFSRANAPAYFFAKAMGLRVSTPAVDDGGAVRYGLFWRGEPLTAESSAEAEDPMNLIQVMLAKGDESFWISPPLFFMEIYDRDEKFF